MTAIGFVVLAAAATAVRAIVSAPDGDFDRQLWATFALNVGGSFLLGWMHASDVDPMVVFGVGGLGSLTTFSAFIAQIECIGREATVVQAAGFTTLTVLAGVAAAAIGYSL